MNLNGYIGEINNISSKCIYSCRATYVSGIILDENVKFNINVDGTYNIEGDNFDYIKKLESVLMEWKKKLMICKSDIIFTYSYLDNIRKIFSNASIDITDNSIRIVIENSNGDSCFNINSDGKYYLTYGNNITLDEIKATEKLFIEWSIYLQDCKQKNKNL